MGKAEPKYLWIDMEQSDHLAGRILSSLTSFPEEQRETLKSAAHRIISQQNQIGALLMRLMETTPPEQLVSILLKSGFSRHELASCWGIDKGLLIAVERQEAAKAPPAPPRPSTSSVELL